MYGIFTYIWLILMVNVGIYIYQSHGSYGVLATSEKYCTHSANGPWKKKLERLIFPTQYVIPKSLKFGHWLSECRKQSLFIHCEPGWRGVDPTKWATSKTLMTFHSAALHFTDWFIHALLMSKRINQWLFLVPLKGGIGGIVHPPIGRKNTTYIPPIVLAFWGVKNATPTTF